MVGADDEETHDIESLRLTRQEARDVLDHQIDTVNHIDDKAAYTLRLNILLLGVLLTVSSLFASNQSTPGIARFGSPAIAVGILCTGGSIVTALWAYTSTQVQVGPDPDDIERLQTNNYTEREWLLLLVRSYAAWMAQNERANRRDGFTLFVILSDRGDRISDASEPPESGWIFRLNRYATLSDSISHTLLFVEIGYYAFGILWGLFVPSWPLWSHFVILIALLPVLVLVVVLPRLPVADRVIFWFPAERVVAV